MNIIVDGQRIVTAAEFIEAASGFSWVGDELDITADFIGGGVSGRDALESFLADLQVEPEPTDVDRENATYYADLLRRMPRPLRRRLVARRTVAGLGAAA